MNDILLIARELRVRLRVWWQRQLLDYWANMIIHAGWEYTTSEYEITAREYGLDVNVRDLDQGRITPGYARHLGRQLYTKWRDDEPNSWHYIRHKGRGV